MSKTTKHPKTKQDKQNKKAHRLAIDHASKFYPIYATKKAQSVFCIGATLTDKVNPATLEQAVNDAAGRFPAFKVRMEKGYGWYYLVPNDLPIKVFEHDGKLLKPIDPTETNGYWFRLSYFDKIVELDVFHSLTDANGAVEFLKTILVRYREIEGVQVEDVQNVLRWNDCPNGEESEDSFEKYYKPISLADVNFKAMAGSRPHRLSGTLNKEGFLSTMASASASQMLEKAKQWGASFTAYFVGLLAYTIDRTCERKHPIVVMIPVNLRKLFPSKTVRNFVTFVRVVIKPGQCTTAQEYVQQAQHQLKEKATKNKLESVISTMVRGQGNLLLRCVPLCVKKFFVKLGRVFMRSRQTIIFSNLGQVSLPKNMGVEDLRAYINVSPNNPYNIGVVTIDGRVRVAFTRAVEENHFPNEVIATLKEQGIDIEVSQREDDFKGQ